MRTPLPQHWGRRGALEARSGGRSPGGWGLDPYPGLIPRGLCLALVLILPWLGRPARAQSVSLSAEPTLGRYYKPNRWLPVSIWLDNQGQTADVEVTAELKDYQGPGAEYRLTVEQLPAPARRRYTLYLLPRASFAARPLELQLIQGRRVVGQQTLNVGPLSQYDRLVAVLDNEEGALNVISGMQVPAGRAAATAFGPPGGPPGSRPGQAPSGQAQVAYLRPDECPDRLKGWDAIDLLVIGNVSARELSEAQKAAITQWVQTGGTVVIGGGANGARLADPFFRDLLPVDVTGSVRLPRLIGMQRFSLKQAPPTGEFVITTATARSGAQILATADGARLPLVVEGRAGAGRVYFMAFDPAKPPARLWEGAPEMWRALLVAAASVPSVLEALDPAVDGAMAGRWAPNRWRVGNACHELSQMDPPKFAYIGLFLLSYIIVLVPVNYYVLKQRDRKEYAWVTTPVIVLVFSLLAYLVGYGMKGGQVLLAKVGVVEAAAGSPVGAAYHYVGLFSPRKTRYDVAAPGANSTLAEWRDDTSSPARPITIEQSEPFRVEDWSVDMWSMRILRLENAAPLGRGITADLKESASALSGSLANNTPYDLEDCQVAHRGQIVKLGTLKRGETKPIPPLLAAGGSNWRGSLLPPGVANVGGGNTALERMKRAMLQPLVTFNPGVPALANPVLIGWVTQPLVNVTVNGRRAREHNVGMLLVHLR